MKKKLVILLGALVLSSVAFSAPAKKEAGKKASASKPSIESSLSNLENQLEKLQKMEDAKFRQQEAQANEAAQRLNNYTAMQAKIDERLAEIEANVDTSIFGKEFKAKVTEYKNLRNQLDKEIAKEQQIIDNFELIKSLR